MESCRLKFTNVKQIGGSTPEVRLQQGIIVGMFGREHQAGVITHLQSRAVEPDSLHQDPDTDPDPAFQVNPDPNPDPEL
jgi:hypothetical protein